MKCVFSIALSVMTFFLFAGEQTTLLFQAVKPYVQNLEKNHAIKLIGSGATGPADIQGIFLHFTIEDSLDLARARRVYVAIVDNIIHQINAYKPVRPFLHDFPITCKNIRLILAFREQEGMPQKSQVALITIGNGIIFYDNLENDEFVTFLEEPYEKALKIVQAEWARVETARAE